MSSPKKSSDEGGTSREGLDSVYFLDSLSDLIECIKWLFIKIKFAVEAISVMLR